MTLSQLLERPTSGEALKAGLPLDEGRLTPDLSERAAERARRADIILAPPIRNIHWADFSQSQQAIDSGSLFNSANQFWNIAAQLAAVLHDSAAHLVCFFDAVFLAKRLPGEARRQCAKAYEETPANDEVVGSV